ncbi:uncharacterized 38.1 kDa protein-like [Papaver somniferum]|uniref:uncharacterized 38.1 kDa protein-like n=1 Tax=Papaver somniferum TaxID=3469 RepID=UPI000E7050DA|nr:uncharacterized 38.1 kDa protein-like [Papaver somniferum]
MNKTSSVFYCGCKICCRWDGLTIFIDAADPREAPYVPLAVRPAVSQRAKARASRDYITADALQQFIADAGYRVIKGPNGGDTLVKKYRIRLRGIDAPEIQMPFGKEAKVELTKLLHGKCLTVGVYGVDQYGRFVGDVHCNGNFAQKIMLQKGLAWHFEKYDKRPELKKWEKEARVARVGLWASPNPEKPWEWRKITRGCSKLKRDTSWVQSLIDEGERNPEGLIYGSRNPQADITLFKDEILQKGALILATSSHVASAAVV